MITYRMDKHRKLMFGLWHYKRLKCTFHLHISVFAINEVHLIFIFIYKHLYLFLKVLIAKISNTQ